MKIAPLVLLLLLATPASAQQLNAYGIIVPPYRYHDMIPGQEIVLHHGNAKTLDRVCASAPRPTGGYGGCAGGSVLRCDVWINTAIPFETYPYYAVYFHELAHCHGWPADHPD